MPSRNSNNSRTPPTPLPVKKIAVLGMILAANNSSIWMIFSFLPFMVSDFYPDLSIKELGYKAGFLGSAFSLGSLCGNFMWGLAADRYGRRPALLGGLLGTVISAILFGFSPTFVVALLARFLWGLLNGNIGVSKTYIAEILDETNSHVGMSVFGVVGGIGRTIGPVIGGFLSTPADHYKIFKGTVFETFPFALPSLTVALSCLIVFTMAYLELQETLKYRVKKGTPDRKKTGSSTAKETDGDGVMSPRSSANQRRLRALTSVQYSEISTADEEDLESGDNTSSASSSSSTFFKKKRKNVVPMAKSEVYGFDRLEVPPPLPAGVEPKRLFGTSSLSSESSSSSSSSSLLEQKDPDSSIRNPLDPYGQIGTGLRYKTTTTSSSGHGSHGSVSSSEGPISPMSPLRDHSHDHQPGMSEGDDGDALSLEDRLHDISLNTAATKSSGESHTMNPNISTNNAIGATMVGSSSSLLPSGDDDILLRRMWTDRPIAADGCGKRISAASSSSSTSSSSSAGGGNIGIKTTLGTAKTVLRKTSSKSSEKTHHHDKNHLKYSNSNSKSADDVRHGSGNYLNNQLTPAKRGVSFSSIVMVKVIGSASLGIGQLKHLRPEDQPMLSDHDDHSNGYGQESLAMTGTIGNNNHNNNGDGLQDGGIPRSRPSVTRYSNGSEFNASLVAQRGTVRQRLMYLLSKRGVFISTLMYGLNGFVQIISTEIFPLWVVTSKADGGLGFNSNNIGAAIMLSGILTIFLQLFVYPAIVETAGIVRTYRFGCHLFAFVVVAMPLISAIDNDGTGDSLFTFAVVVTALTLMGTATMFILISVFVLINNSCYSHERATVNGIGQTCAALGRLTGPYLGSLVFAWSETNGQLWPFNYFFVWYLLAILAVMNARVSYLLPRSIERRRREPREPRYASLASTGTGLMDTEDDEEEDDTAINDELEDLIIDEDYKDEMIEMGEIGGDGTTSGNVGKGGNTMTNGATSMVSGPVSGGGGATMVTSSSSSSSSSSSELSGHVGVKSNPNPLHHHEHDNHNHSNNHNNNNNHHQNSNGSTTTFSNGNAVSSGSGPSKSIHLNNMGTNGISNVGSVGNSSGGTNSNSLRISVDVENGVASH